MTYWAILNLMLFTYPAFVSFEDELRYDDGSYLNWKFYKSRNLFSKIVYTTSLKTIIINLKSGLRLATDCQKFSILLHDRW